MHLVVVTNLWPGPRRPAWGSFVAARVDALRRLGHRVEVIAVGDQPSALSRYAGLAAAVVARSLRPRDRRCDLVEAHIAYPTGLFARLLVVALQVPLVLFAHGSDVLRAPTRSRIDRILVRRLFRRPQLVIANTAYLAEEVRARLDVEPERVAVCPPGIRYADFASAPKPEARGVPLLFVGNLIHRKAVDVLLDALAALPEAERPPLRVVGDGVERADLEAQARRLGLDVTFAGAATQEEVAAEMARAQVLAVPSREEALGLVALEGMAAGCVVVASQVGGLATTVREGSTGFGCPPEAPEALAAALRRAREAAADPVRLDTLQRSGDELARHHDVDAVTARTVELLEPLVGPRSRADGRTGGVR